MWDGRERRKPKISKKDALGGFFRVFLVIVAVYVIVVALMKVQERSGPPAGIKPVCPEVQVAPGSSIGKGQSS